MEQHYLNNGYIIDTNDTEEQILILKTICQKLQSKRANKSDIDLCRGFLSSAGDVITDIPMTSKYVLACLYVLTMTVSAVGNSLVVLSFVCNRHMRSALNVFILSLAVSDLCVTVTCMPVNVVTAFSRHWVLGEFCCKLVPFMINLTVASSSLTLCCIAIDRYIAIVRPLSRRLTKTRGGAAAFLVTVWLLAVASSAPYAYLYELRPLCADGPTCRDVTHICVAEDDGPAESLKMWMTFVVLLIVPFVLVGVTYVIIGLRLWGKTTVGAERVRCALDQQTRYRRKAIEMLVIVVLLYALCWSPLLVFDVVSKETNLQASALNFNIRYYLQWLALSGACYNPVIYAFMNEKFRKNFAKLLLCQRARVHVLGGQTQLNRVNIVIRNESERTVSGNNREYPEASESVAHI